MIPSKDKQRKRDKDLSPSSSHSGGLSNILLDYNTPHKSSCFVGFFLSMESIISFPLTLSTNQASCCISSCISPAKSNLCACSTLLLHVAPVALSHPGNPKFYFQSIKELPWRAKGWVVEQGYSLSTNPFQQIGWAILFQSPWWNPALPSFPWKAFPSGVLSQAMGVTSVKVHRKKKQHFPVIKGEEERWAAVKMSPEDYRSSPSI